MNLSAVVRVLVVLVVLSVLTLFFWQKKHNVSAEASTQSVQSANASTSLPFGFPAIANSSLVGGELQFLHNTCYDVGYNNIRGNPSWVVYGLHRHKDDGVAKRPSKFVVDDRTAAKIVHEHYTHSGYDRGHMAPNHAIGALCSDDAQMETFKMSNIIPQTPNLNQKWWERLERVEFTHFTKIFDQVWVIDGPVFALHPVTLPNSSGKVQVPEENYKIHLAQKDGKWYAIAFLVPQSVQGSEPFSQYLTTIEQIEQKTGLSFLKQLSTEDQARLKKSKGDVIWQLDQVDNLPAKY